MKKESKIVKKGEKIKNKEIELTLEKIRCTVKTT